MNDIHVSPLITSFQEAQLTSEIRTILTSSAGDKSDVTSLHQFLDNREWNLEEIEKFLISDSSTVNEPDDSNRTPLVRVIEDNAKSSVGVIKLLLRFGANVNDNRGDLPLLAALRSSKDEAVVKVLLDAGADTNSNRLYAPLCVALRGSAPKEVIKLLLDSGCALDACGQHSTVIHCAMGFSLAGLKDGVLTLLIEAGADVNRINMFRRSPLCLALRNKPEARVIEILLRAGASLSACKCHSSPLICATESCVYYKMLTADVVKLLLEAGSKVEEVDSLGRTPLQRALTWCKYETAAIRLLFDRMDVDRIDAWSEQFGSLLHLTLENPHCKPSVVKFLLKRKVKVDKVNQLGNTALHLAVEINSQADIIDVLLKHGFSVKAKNFNGDTPLALAFRKCRNPAILGKLWTAGARIGAKKVSNVHSLLKSILDNFDPPQEILKYCKTEPEMKLMRCKMLVKYSCLENVDIDFHDLFKGYRDSETVLSFAGRCVRELQKMKSKHVVHGRTLRTFISRYSSPRINANKSKPNNYDFNQLVKEVMDNAFPIYFDVISAKVGRSPLKEKLHKLMLYALRYPNFNSMNEKVIWNIDSVCEVTKYLSDEDLLRLILSFYNGNDHSYRGHACRKKNLKSKQTSEPPAKVPKRRRLHRNCKLV